MSASQGGSRSLYADNRTGVVADNLLCQTHVQIALYGSDDITVSRNSTGGDVDTVDWFPESFFTTDDSELNMRRLAMAKGVGGGITNSGRNNQILDNMFCSAGYGVEENGGEGTVYRGNIIQRHEIGAVNTPGTRARVNFDGNWFGDAAGDGPCPSDVSSYGARHPVRTCISDHDERIQRPVEHLRARPPLPPVGACPVPTYPPRPEE